MKISDKYKKLKQTIESTNLLPNLLVRPYKKGMELQGEIIEIEGQKYQIMAGHRLLKIIGLKEISVIIDNEEIKISSKVKRLT